MSLSKTIKAIQDIMRKDAGVDGDAQRIGQLGWMLFLKIYSDLELETELEDTKYKSPIPQKFRWESWADENMAGKDSLTGDALIIFINNELFPKLKELDLSSFSGQARERGGLLISVFDDAYNYMKNGTLLRQVINKLNQDIDYNSVETRHLFGDIYEQILKDLQNAGNAGEYYTPRSVTQFAIEMVNPKLGEIVLDPACGTGGFLTGAFEHMRKQVGKPAELKALKNSIRGVEKKPLPHVLCATNMMIHGIEVPSNIINDNTLAKPLRDYGKSDQVDVIITNPPFGGVEEDGIENNFPAEFRTKETADLFLVLVMELLKDGGRAAIVLPDGTLFGEGVKTKIKKKMLEECNLHTIVRLPKSVFAPYTDIATNILFLTNGEPTKDIWYFEHRLPKGSKGYNKTNPMKLTEFDIVKEWWTDRVENEQAWKVSVAEIVENNFNLDIKNPNSVIEDHADPEDLLIRYARTKKEVQELENSLKEKLQTSLKSAAEVANVFQNIEVIFDSPHGLAQLKSIILDLAFKGELMRETTGSSADWKNEALQDVCEYIQRGKSPKYANSGECLVVSQKSVHWSGLRLESARFIEDTSLGKYTEERFLRNGDILWNSTGTGTVGRTAIFQSLEDKRKYVADSHVTVLRSFIIVSRFLHYWTRSPRVQELVLGSTTGSTNQQELNLSTIKSIKIAYPKEEHQILITNYIDMFLKLCDELELKLNEVHNIADQYTRAVTSRLA